MNKSSNSSNKKTIKVVSKSTSRPSSTSGVLRSPNSTSSRTAHATNRAISSSNRATSNPSSRPTTKSATHKGHTMKTSLYDNLLYKIKTRRDARDRKRAEDLATLPKQPIARFFAKLHPKRVLKFWFSFDGLKFLGKTIFGGFLIGIILLGGLFLYFKKDLNAIKLDKLEVSDTVNTYLDRNGKLLWEDRGEGSYRLVVDGANISSYMRQATVAIEDRNFYNHPGINFRGLARAFLATLSGKGVQGGSTITQQLIKQVYFAEEAANRGLSGIPRKIKEAILALEVEKMYNKEQIITMYLNESPYGGRRNGVESGARTYFGKSAKTLTLAESALLASIPNNPAVLNPYNVAGRPALLSRQHKTLDVMAELGYISAQQAEEAKKVPIFDQIKPEGNQYQNLKAPHYVLEVKKQLEEKYGVKMMRKGGFTIKTTLDLRLQDIAEQAVATGAKMMRNNGSNNISLSSVDVETGQVIAMVGSSNWETPVYGQVNAATALLEPGSTIKPILDYAPLFTQRSGQNFGPGTILRDENIDAIYCAGASSNCRLRNYTGAFYGNVTIRQSLANSLNIGAVKSLYINGVDESLKVARGLGDISYCSNNSNAGLSMAIGSGCNVRPIEHANAYASLARGGIYKALSYVLEIKNSAGDVIESWKDLKGTRVIEDQAAYLIMDILGDASARGLVFGAQAHSFGFNIPNVWTASKTGTTTTNISSMTKDSWIASVSPAISTVVWNGNHDGSGLHSSSNDLVRRVVHNYMSGAHLDVYEKDGKWQKNQKPQQPAGIQTLTVNGRRDLWPSWYNSKTSGTETQELEFNKYTKKLAAECTPKNQIVTITATKTTDPVSKKTFWYVPEPYDRETEDTCNYQPPTVKLYRYGSSLRVSISKGSAKLDKYDLLVDGEVKEEGQITNTSFDLKYKLSSSDKKIKIRISDTADYVATDEID